jgi:SpoVK/Ycf46/Vps4 family AAA+-type ATPase
MIKITEALSPCVLWIDEIDKAFGQMEGKGDSGTTTRVLGTFITWLAEKQSKVFVVATANNFKLLPLELIRKGRFDEIFFVGLPSRLERSAIFEVLLKKFRPKTWKKFEINEFLDLSFNFSGAEIEQAIVEGMYSAFEEEREFEIFDIMFGLAQIIPLAQINEEEIENLQ